MTDWSAFSATARDTYLEITLGSIRWMLNRCTTDSPWLNTKFNAINQKDYLPDDGIRGPDHRYSWTQGRGLEALVTHSKLAKAFDAPLAERMAEQAKTLYQTLNEDFSATGSASFCYNANNTPICTEANNLGQPQQRESGIETCSDLFVVKGLIAASAQHAPTQLPYHLRQLQNIIEAIKADHFLLNESGHITHQALAEQSANFKPRMIALSAASLLRKLNLAEYDNFSSEFLEDVLHHHLNPTSTLISDSPQGTVCNVGHAIELVGLFLESRGKEILPAQTEQLGNILLRSFESGFTGYGICLTVNAHTKEKLSNLCPWWSLPETIRAASLTASLTKDVRYFQVWQQAHNAFMNHFWRQHPPVAYQMLYHSEVVDITPATSDLDPCYHTGMSLLTAINMVENATTAC